MTTYLHLASRFRLNGAVPPAPSVRVWHVQDNFNFIFSSKWSFFKQFSHFTVECEFGSPLSQYPRGPRHLRAAAAMCVRRSTEIARSVVTAVFAASSPRSVVQGCKPSLLNLIPISLRSFRFLFGKKRTLSSVSDIVEWAMFCVSCSVNKRDFYVDRVIKWLLVSERGLTSRCIAKRTVLVLSVLKWTATGQGTEYIEDEWQ